MTARKPKRLRSVSSTEIVKADEAVLARDAYKLRKDGYSLFQIAEMLKTPESRIMRVLRDETAEAARLVTEGARNDLLTLEVSRLDDLQRAVWPAALAGNTRAVDTALHIINQRAKLLGLEQAQVESVNQTVVINADKESYAEALRVLASGMAIEEG